MITITGTNPFSSNKGISAMCMATIHILLEGNLQHKITVINSQPEKDCFGSLFNTKYRNNKDIEIIHLYDNKLGHTKGAPLFVEIARLHLCILYRIMSVLYVDITNMLYRDKLLQKYLQSDVIIQVNWGDDFTDTYGYDRSLSWIRNYLVPILLNKTTVFFPQTIGPFNNMLTHLVAKFILNHAKILVVREQISGDLIRKMGVEDKKIFIIPDTAMVLEPIILEDAKKILKNENIPNTKKVIGITLRDLFTPNCVDKVTFEKYIYYTSKLVDYMINKYNVSIVLIPHEGMNRKTILKDDSITLEILKTIKNKEYVYWIHQREYTVEELKGIIGRCDLFIGAYMHANIGALSMCVPTIGLSYSHKFQGIFDMLGQEKYVLNLKDLTYEDLISKVDDAWTNREKIRKELQERMPEIKKRVMFAGELVKKVLDEQEPK